MSENVILLEEFSSFQADTESVIRAVVSPSPSDTPEKKVAEDSGEESSVGGSEGPVKENGVYETEAGTEGDVKDGEVDVVGGIDEVGVPGYDSEGFALSEIFRRKKLAKQNVSGSVFDTTHLPLCEFSNLHVLSLFSLLEILRWPVIEFC